MLQILEMFYFNVPGHVSSELEEPGHDAPPFKGLGSLHSLVLFLFPVRVLHELHDPHSPQAPFTNKGKIKMLNIF